LLFVQSAASSLVMPIETLIDGEHTLEGRNISYRRLDVSIGIVLGKLE